MPNFLSHSPQTASPQNGACCWLRIDWKFCGHKDTTLPPSILDKKWSLHAPPFLDRRRCFRFLLELLQGQQFQVIHSWRLTQWQVAEISIIFKSCMRSCGGGTRIRNRTLYSTSSTLPQKHRQDVEKHDPSASVEAEVDAAVSTATFSYSRLGRA